MTEPLDTVLLLALPASGKSEVRRYLAHLDAGRAAADFHLGPTVQLDDFPYVHLMRVISEASQAAGGPAIFFETPDSLMEEGRDWGTLIELLNEDYDRLRSGPGQPVERAADWMLDRFDRARQVVGAEPALGRLTAEVRQAVAARLEDEARALHTERVLDVPASLEGKTIVIEFARGGPDGATLPLDPPHGYRYSLACLSEAILSVASILYVWVTPEESRRKNRARTDPDDPGSILHHGVPETVMLGDYGTDDMDWLIEASERPGTVTVAARGKTFHLPVGRFDNRVDRTSFLRAEPDQWPAEDVAALHAGLKAGFDALVRD